MNEPQTREQFAAEYALHSGVTVQWLRDNGREAAPCDCEEEGCAGWQMAHRRALEEMEAEGFMLPVDRETLGWLRAHEPSR